MWRRTSSCDFEAETTELKSFLASNKFGDLKRDCNWGGTDNDSGELGFWVFRETLAGFLGKWRGFGGLDGELRVTREEGFVTIEVEMADLKDGGNFPIVALLSSSS